MKRTKRLVAALALMAALVSGCGGDDDAAPEMANECIEQVQLRPCGLADPGPGLAFAAAVEFPQDDPFGGLQPYRLELVRDPDGGEVGVFHRSATGGSGSRNELRRVGIVGPSDLRGIGFVHRAREYVVAARGLSTSRLMAVARSIRDEGVQTVGATVAHQDESWVPGIGSLPIPSAGRGYAISYTSSAAGHQREEQRSIAVGVAGGQESDVEVLRWWYGNYRETSDNATAIMSEAYATPDGQSSPTALLTVALDEVGPVVILRTVGMGQSRHLALFADLGVVQGERWNGLVARTRDDRERGSES